MKKKFFCAIAATLFLAATGCDNGEESLGELNVSQTTSSIEQISVFPTEVCSVELLSAPEKVVSLSPAVTEIIYELGFGDKLCGISSYCDYPEGISKITVGSSENPNLEAIKELSPDLVITLSGLSERDKYELTYADINVVELNAVRSLSDYRSLYSDIAKCFYGNEQTESEKQTEICTDIANTAMATIDIAAKDITLESYIYVTSKLTAAGSDTFEGSVLSLLGENLCAQSGYADIPEGIEPAYIIADSSLKNDEIAASALANIGGSATIIYVSAERFERPSARICSVFEEINQAISEQQ